MTQSVLAFLDTWQTQAPMPAEGPDRDYIPRKLRECSMWANSAIVRHPDGGPRATQYERG
jgi:hypothetical protein